MTSASDLAAALSFLPVKQRNAALDRLFYDTSSLTAEELATLSPLVDREGSVIVVPPSRSAAPIRHYRKALRFMNKEGQAIRAIAVAGVGSSVVGTAALARNVADAIGGDVAGVVTGYGVTDLMTEALGGWFVFGAADRARLQVEEFVGKASGPLPQVSASATRTETGPAFSASFESINGTNDVATLVDILSANPPRLELLVGHSKGSLIIDFVLEQFVDELEGDPHPLFERLRIVTLGAVVGLPSAFKQVHQYLGALDWFGAMNSRLALPRTQVPGAWHHLNRGLPYHLDAIKAVRRAMEQTARA